MNTDKPNFLSQPVVKNVFMYRNGDPYYEARRIVINQKRVCNFDTLLREVSSGIQAPFGAVRNIYTPRGGHKVERLENLQSGQQYVAAGRERFKKLDYFEIGPRKKRMLQALPLQAKPLPQNRIKVSARFLKPIKEPCPVFLFTYEGQIVTDGNQLESGQLYVAVGRDKFKKLPYIDLLFSKPRGMTRMKAYSLPPIYRMSKQNGNSVVQSSDSGDSPPALNGNSKEHLSAIVREISQSRLISLRKKRSGQNMALDDVEGKADSKEEYDLQNQTEEQSRPPTNKETANGDGLPSDKSDLDVPGEDPSDPTGADSKGNSTGHECSPSHNVNNAERDEKSSAEEGTGQGQGPRDKTPDSNEKKDQGSSNGEQNDQDKSAEAVEDIDSGMGANHDGSNDADTGEEQKVQIDDSDEGDKAQTDNESKETQGEDANTAQDGTDSSIDTEQPGEVSGEVSAEHDEVKSEADLDADKKDPDTEKE